MTFSIETFDPGLARLSIDALENSHPFHMISAQKGQWVHAAPGGGIVMPTPVGYGSSSRFTLTRVPNTYDIFRLFATGENNFVSAIGPGWRLHAHVEDEQWSHFRVRADRLGRITFQSSVPIAAATPYVSVYGADHDMRIVEPQPVEAWSYFVPFAA